MDKIVIYLEKLGYTVEEQGKVEKYLVVFKDGLPLGFILQDLTVKLVSDAEKHNDIQKIISFVNQNNNLSAVGASEFLLLSFKGNQLTNYFDVNSMEPHYVTYIHDGTGEVRNTVYNDYDTAIYTFVTQTQMIDLKKFSARKVTVGERIRNKLLDYLLTKSREQAEQH